MILVLTGGGKGCSVSVRGSLSGLESVSGGGRLRDCYDKGLRESESDGSTGGQES